MAVAHKSAISVGLIYVPVSLYKTTRDTGVSFNQLCTDTKERVKYKKICPSCNKEVKNDEIIKGYEYEKGKYVTFTTDELEKIKSKKDKTIHIMHFAKMSDIDNIYYEKNYYVVPELGGEKAFELLRQAMLNKKQVAVAKTVMGNKEELIVLYPQKDGIIAKLLFYNEEIQETPYHNVNAYHDEYQEKLRNAIQTKIEGQEIVNADTSLQDNNIINLMEALQKTVEMTKSGTGIA